MQYKLKTLLLVVTVPLGLAGCGNQEEPLDEKAITNKQQPAEKSSAVHKQEPVVEETLTEAQVITKVEKLGGRVGYDRNRAVVEIILQATDVTDAIGAPERAEPTQRTVAHSDSKS